MPPMKPLPALLPPLATAVAAAADLRSGRDINEVCAGCHGELGQGGQGGEYPRLAGQPAAYLARQLKPFRARIRPNMPMLPHTEERELPDADIEEISACLAALRLATRLPPPDDAVDAYTRLREAGKVLNIARAGGGGGGRRAALWQGVS